MQGREKLAKKFGYIHQSIYLLEYLDVTDHVALL
jgi:ABC-type lipoprotein export system ATPase subunit